MNYLCFGSDNYAGVCPEAWQAMLDANNGNVPSYGDDEWTKRAFLLINAKSKFSEQGILGERAGSNGVIAVYKAKRDRTLKEWEATPLCFATGKPEADCPTLYYDKEKNEHIIIFSCQSDRDYLRRTLGESGKIEGAPDEQGETWQIRIPNLEALLKEPPEKPVKMAVTKVTDADRFSYANRIVPELSGALLGFDTRTGKPMLSATEEFKNVEAALADFSDFEEV